MAYIDILCMRSRMLGNGSIKPNDNYVRSSQNHIHINVTPTYSKYLCFGGVERPPQSNHTHTKHVKKYFWKNYNQKLRFSGHPRLEVLWDWQTATNLHPSSNWIGCLRSSNISPRKVQKSFPPKKSSCFPCFSNSWGTPQHDNVLWMTTNCWDLDIGDVFQGVRDLSHVA